MGEGAAPDGGHRSQRGICKPSPIQARNPRPDPDRLPPPRVPRGHVPPDHPL
jgi:hypothetical protein